MFFQHLKLEILNLSLKNKNKKDINLVHSKWRRCF